MDLDTITRQCPYGDQQLTYHEVGQKSSYPTIILIHGTGGNTDKHFSYIFPMLGIHQRVLSIDLHTPDKADLAVADFSQQVEALIQHAVEADEVITVVGYSLGAVIAAQVAASLKQRVVRLILLAGWAKPVQCNNYEPRSGNSYLTINPQPYHILSIIACIAMITCLLELKNKCSIWHAL